MPRYQTDWKYSTKPGFPFITVFVGIALAVPITLLCIACRLKPSLRRYRIYARRCEPMNAVPEDEETGTKRRSRGKSTTQPYIDPAKISWLQIFSGKPPRKRSRMEREKSKGPKTGSDSHPRGPTLSNDGVLMSGAWLDKLRHVPNTVRRRRTNSTEKTYTSAYLESVTANAASNVIFGGPENLKRLKDANKDIEAALDACDDDSDSDDVENAQAVSASRRGFSMPQMHTKSLSHTAKIKLASEDRPAFTQIFEPPPGVHPVAREFGHFTRVEPGENLKLPADNRTASSSHYPSSILDEYTTAAHPDSDSGYCTNDTLSFDQSQYSAVDATSQSRPYEVAMRRSIEDYEAQDELDDASPLRDITSSTLSIPDNLRTTAFDIPDYEMTGYYEQSPIRPDENTRHIRTPSSSQKFYTARSCLACPSSPKTPNNRFPLRRIRHRYSEPRPLKPFRTADFSNQNTFFSPRVPGGFEYNEGEDNPFQSPPSTSKLPRRKRAMQMSPVPALLKFGLDGAGDGESELDVPRKRPSIRSRGTDGSSSDARDQLPRATRSPNRKAKGNATLLEDGNNIFERIEGELKRQIPATLHSPAYRKNAASPEEKPKAKEYTAPEPKLSSGVGRTGWLGDMGGKSPMPLTTPATAAGSTAVPTDGVARKASPSSVRYSNARITGPPRSKEEFERQKRKFSAPAEYERMQRRVRRTRKEGGSLRDRAGGSGRFLSGVGVDGGRIEGQGPEDLNLVEKEVGRDQIEYEGDEDADEGDGGNEVNVGVKRGGSKHRREGQHIIPNAPLV